MATMTNACGNCGAPLDEWGRCSYCNDTMRSALATWSSAFEGMAVHVPRHSPVDLTNALKAKLGKFTMAPRDLERAAKFEMKWVWVPIVSAYGTFAGEWTGTARPFSTVTTRGPKGSTRTHTKTYAPKTFRGSVPRFARVVYLLGTDQVNSLITAGDLVGNSDPKSASLREAEPFLPFLGHGTPLPTGCSNLAEAARNSALRRMDQEAQEAADKHALAELHEQTPGEWQDHGVNVTVRPADERGVLLHAVPMLVGSYRYGTGRWLVTASGASGKVAVQGAPTSVVKVVLALVGVTFVLAGVAVLLDVGGLQNRLGLSGTKTASVPIKQAPPVVARTTAAPIPTAPTSHCGDPGHQPRGTAPPKDWTLWTCQTATQAGNHWGLCLSRATYSEVSGMGCDGDMRCCPPSGSR